MSRHVFEALGALKKPASMTIDQALAAPNPIEAISQRLAQKPDQAMSTPERVFVAVTSFVGDVFDDGLEQTLTGPVGELADLFAEFIARYGDDALRAIVRDLAALFPSGLPADPAQRSAAVHALGGDDPLDALTERLEQCEDAIEAGLLTLVRNNRQAFEPAGGGDPDAH